MSLPQEDTFFNRQNCRSNIGLIENPMGTSFDISQNNSHFQKSQPNFDSLKRNQNLSNGMENNLKQLHQMKNVSSGILSHHTVALLVIYSRYKDKLHMKLFLH